MWNKKHGGVIAAVAADVQGFSIGDEVYSMVRFPSGAAGGSRAYAEYVSAPATEVALKPKNIDFVHAAGAPMSLLTAWQFIIEQDHDAPNPLQASPHQPIPLEGKTILINGAAGGVGHFAVQLAKWKHAQVIAVASGKHEAFLRDLDVDEFIDYEKLGVKVSTTQVRSSGKQLTKLADLLNTGVIQVALDSTFALADARSAHEQAARQHTQGKIALTVQ